jgi:hypothetical protein
MTVLSPACARVILECARVRLALAPITPHALHLALVPLSQPDWGIACW